MIDPGKDAAEGVAQVVREHKLKPVAVLVTHGHVDHMWCVAPVAGTYDATAWIHPDDRHLLANPMAGMSRRDHRDAARGQVRVRRARPRRGARRRPDASSSPVSSFVVDHTPGHTEGSVTFRTPYAAEDVSEVMFSGDLLFAGSIGRTDLPGGDHPTMLRSLRDKVLTLPDDIVVLPGHGEQTSIGRERATNPFLLDLIDDEPARRAPSPEGSEMTRPTPLSGFPELLPAQRHVEQQVLARLAETFELHGFASVETRAVEPLDQLLTKGETSKEVYVLRRLQAEEGDAGIGAALRPHRAVRALRARERRQARVPVPPLPDPEGVARRAAAGGPVPRVHPGRHRRDRARHPGLPPRRRGRPGDARRAARRSTSLPGFRSR